MGLPSVDSTVSNTVIPRRVLSNTVSSGARCCATASDPFHTIRPSGEKTTALYGLLDRRGDVFGASLEDAAQRYTGETLRLSQQSIQDVDELLIMSSCAGRVLQEAEKLLRKKGLAAAAKKSHRETGQGLVESYIHGGGKVGVLIEVNCETDFVARTDAFRTLVRDLAMQVAAATPLAVSPEELDPALVAKEREILTEQAKASGKPEKIIEKMVEGRVQKFYEEVCLLEQPFVKDQDRRVKDIVTDAIAKIGENIRVRRFTRYQLGR